MSPARPPRVGALPLMAGLLALSGCDANPFDPAQPPTVQVQAGTPPVISWTPADAQIVRVYRGSTAGDGYTPNLVWDVSATTGTNALQSPLRYGEAPAGVQASVAQALVPGQAYTVWVFRGDARGAGDGFTNTRNTYTGTATFVP